MLQLKPKSHHVRSMFGHTASYDTAQIVQSRTSSSIKLLVCDMQGTTIDDGGIANSCFRRALRVHNTELQRNRFDLSTLKYDVNRTFEYFLLEEYEKYPGKIKFVRDDLPDYFEELRDKGIQIAVNTEYSAKIQDFILDRLGMKSMIDAYVCAEDVGAGRPAPDMLLKLMNDCGVDDPMEVCKVGDTVLDIQEGNSLGAGLVVSVLTGECMFANLMDQGQHIILNDVTALQLV